MQNGKIQNNTSVNKGEKWNSTSAPQPFRSRRKGDSHDAYYVLGRKKYGLTRADADMESVLLEDYRTYAAIWNAYEDNQILISPELAAAIKAKIQSLEK